MSELNEIEQVVRTRLRSLRNTLGLSLDELAARTNLSPSTISRVETGKRTISLDILLPLATALQVDLDALLDVRSDDDVVIRPTRDHRPGRRIRRVRHHDTARLRGHRRSSRAHHDLRPRRPTRPRPSRNRGPADDLNLARFARLRLRWVKDDAGSERRRTASLPSWTSRPRP
jgi:transcriptional regulator with XRE-family HTH domain